MVLMNIIYMCYERKQTVTLTAMKTVVMNIALYCFKVLLFAFKLLTKLKSHICYFSVVIRAELGSI